MGVNYYDQYRKDPARPEGSVCRLLGLMMIFDALSSIRADSLTNYHDVLEAIHRSARVSIGVQCVMLYAEGYSYDEIAEMLGIKPGTVKSRVAAGRAAIRAALE